MARNTYGNVGYEPGKTAPFTPAAGATWIPAFNQKLEILNRDSGVSRNKLTSMLLEQALKGADDNSVAIDCSDLTAAEAELLKTDFVQTMIKNMLRELNGVSDRFIQNASTMSKDLNAPSFPNTSEHSEANSDTFSEVPKQAPEVLKQSSEVPNELSQLAERLEPKESTGEKSKILSPLERARQRHKNNQISLED